MVEGILAEKDNFAFFAALKKAKDDLRSLAAEEMHDLIDFFTTKRDIWDRLRRGMDSVAPNRDLLALDGTASAALAELEGIRCHLRPYGQLHRIDPLLATVSTVNDALVAQRRTAAIAAIDAQVERLLAQLKTAGGSDSQCNDALAGLQRLRTQVGGETSIPRITMLAGEHLDQAVTFVLNRLQAIVSAKDAKPGALTSAIPLTPVKEPMQVRAGVVGIKPYLESEDDIEQYLGVLRGMLRDALTKSGRVRVL